VQVSERRDAQRLAVALAAAVVVHVGLYFAVPFLASLDTGPLPDYGPIVVTLEEPAAALESPPPMEAPKPTPAPQQELAPPPVPAPAAKPAPAPAIRTAPATAAAAPKLAVDAGAAPVATRAPSASAFRQSGAATGTSAGKATASIVPGPPPVTLPAVGSTTPGSGEQRSGEGVLLSGRPAAGSGTLDTRKLDSSLASPAAGTAAAATRTSGSATGPVIAWDNPSAAKGRDPRSDPVVELTDAVRKQSLLPPEVTVVITVDADGLVSSAAMAPSSGYREVDNACIEAVRRVKFTAAPGAAPITGRWTFRIVR